MPFQKLLPGRARTRHQIQSAIIGVIGVGLEGVWDCYWLVKESRNHCTERNSYTQTPLFCFFLCQLRLLHKGFFSLPRPPSQRNCIDLFYLLLPYASSYLSCKWKWDPKLQQMGPCHWMQMFSAPRPEYTCPIKLTLTPPPTEQTSLLQTLRSSNLFWVEARGTTVCPHVVNKKWWYQTPGPGLLEGAAFHVRGLQFGLLVSPLAFCWLWGESTVWRGTPACGVILGGRGWETTVMEGWKNSKRGVEGDDCERLTGASSPGLWETHSSGNVCKWEQALPCPYPFIKSLYLSLFLSPPSFWIIRKRYKSGLTDNLPNWLNVAESLEC